MKRINNRQILVFAYCIIFPLIFICTAFENRFIVFAQFPLVLVFDYLQLTVLANKVNKSDNEITRLKYLKYYLNILYIPVFAILLMILTSASYETETLYICLRIFVTFSLLVFIYLTSEDSITVLLSIIFRKKTI